MAEKMQLSGEDATFKRTEERTEKHVCDLIDRQAAIDICTNAIDLWHGQLGEGALVAVQERIKALPSAQQEIVRCKDCKYFAGEGMYCTWNIIVQFDHFYCYHGDRKELP